MSRIVKAYQQRILTKTPIDEKFLEELKTLCKKYNAIPMIRDEAIGVDMDLVGEMLNKKR